MKARRIQPARFGLFFLAALWLLVILPLSAIAALRGLVSPLKVGS